MRDKTFDASPHDQGSGIRRGAALHRNREADHHRGEREETPGGGSDPRPSASQGDGHQHAPALGPEVPRSVRQSSRGHSHSLQRLAGCRASSAPYACPRHPRKVGD